ncbi:MAG: hypothetical protein LBF12_02595 [Christensenellaceae bacterium]|jgi:hypothetical protein|nr:hypothetical protein [Christensenellaceae bacterium]
MTDLYDAIFKRRSVRKFIYESISDADLKDIAKYIKSIEQLPGQKAEFAMGGEKDVRFGHAPYYIFAFCEPTTAAYMNVGYILAQTELYIQQKGWGSLWLGTKRPILENITTKFPLCITMAFGRTLVEERKGLDEFERLDVLTISDKKNEISEAARLAPSATNSQPWRLKFDDEENQIIINYVGRGPLRFFLKKRLNKIDLGIMAAFVSIALDHVGATILSIKTSDIINSFSITVKYKNWLNRPTPVEDERKVILIRNKDLK